MGSGNEIDLIGSGLNLLCLQAIQNRNVVGLGQRSRFLVLTKRSAASGDENGVKQAAFDLQQKETGSKTVAIATSKYASCGAFFSVQRACQIPIALHHY